MRAKQGQRAEAVVKDIRRQTRRKFTAEERMRIVLEGLKGEASISELCRREGIVSNLYYRGSKRADARACGGQIVNLLGQHVRTLVDVTKSAGNHKAVWDGTDAAGK